MNNDPEIKGKSSAETVKKVEDLLHKKWLKKLSTYRPYDSNDRVAAQGY